MAIPIPISFIALQFFNPTVVYCNGIFTLTSQCRCLFFWKIWNDMRNHHVVTGHHYAFAFYLIRLVVIDVVYEDITRTIGIATMLYINNRTV